MKKYVYNLSYDISNKEANKCALSSEERLERGKKFIEFLYNSKILLLNKSFSLVGNNGKKGQYNILKPVESTIIFASQMKRKDICAILNRHEELSYVLTDIPQAGTKNIGTLRCVGENKEFQKVCDETLPALVELKKKGVVGHVGITDLQPENLKWVIEHVEEGTVESILNFCHYSLNDTLLMEYLGFFEQHGVGVINASPLSMGLLSQRGAPAWHPAGKDLQNACARAAAYCQEQGYPIEKLAIQFSTSLNPRIATTLFSSANPDNVLKNINYVNDPMDEDLVKKVQEIIGDQMFVRWKNS